MSLLQFHCINVQENQFFKTDDVLVLLNVCYSNKRITFYNTFLLDMYELSVFWSTVQRQSFLVYCYIHFISCPYRFQCTVAFSDKGEFSPFAKSDLVEEILKHVPI